MKVIEEVTVKQCFHSCPFFGGGHEMECCHPYWDDKGVYENMIITHNNSRDRVPELCPLRLEGITTTTTIKLDNKLRPEINKNKNEKDRTKI